MDIEWAATAKDALLVTGRIATIFPLLLCIAVFMGRRSIGELPIFDFLIILCLGAVVGADIADPKIEHIHTGVAMIVIALMQKLYLALLIRYRRFGKLVSFEPIVVIKDGMFLPDNLKKSRYPIDNILQMLRELDIFDIAEVDTAVLEANGKLTAFKKPDRSAATRAELGVASASPGISYPVILEGRVERRALSELKVSESWLMQQLDRNHLRLADVFYAALNEKRELNITVRYKQPKAPPVFH